MFLIPPCGARAVRERLPWWTAAACACGVVAIVFVLILNAYPFVDVQSPGVFAVRIPGTFALVNACGYGFYRVRRRRCCTSPTGHHSNPQVKSRSCIRVRG